MCNVWYNDFCKQIRWPVGGHAEAAVAAAIAAIAASAANAAIVRRRRLVRHIHSSVQHSAIVLFDLRCRVRQAIVLVRVWRTVAGRAFRRDVGDARIEIVESLGWLQSICLAEENLCSTSMSIATATRVEHTLDATVERIRPARQHQKDKKRPSIGHLSAALSVA